MDKNVDSGTRDSKGNEDDEETWSKERAKFDGSTFMIVPWYLKWVTLGLEEHCIHHANPKVPCYRLAECRESGQLKGLWNGVTQLCFFANGGLNTMCNTMWNVK